MGLRDIGGALGLQFGPPSARRRAFESRTRQQQRAHTLPVMPVSSKLPGGVTAPPFMPTIIREEVRRFPSVSRKQCPPGFRVHSTLGTCVVIPRGQPGFVANDAIPGIQRVDKMITRRAPPPPSPVVKAAESRPVVPSSPLAIAGGPTETEQEMGIFGFLGGALSGAIGIAEGITGINVPLIGPGDRFLGGGSAAPGGRAPLTIAGLAGTGCQEGFEMRNGRCERSGFLGGLQRAIPGGSTGLQTTGPGSQVGGMGGYAPAEIPTSRADCGRGAVLGRDGLCYDKSSIRNSDRMWPKARRPLLTGGDLNCIAKASRAANRLKTQTKRLQKLGMLQRPRGRR